MSCSPEQRCPSTVAQNLRAILQRILSLFNVKKSKVLIFGKIKGTAIDPLSLSGQLIEFVPHWKYLGTTFFTGNQLTFSSKPELSCFYCSFNSLLSCERKPNELVLMNLLYANCVPSLTYASEVKDV